MPNVNDVRIGAPEQKTTGAIKHAPVGTTLPVLSDIGASGVTLDPAFVGDEYVSEDGLTLSPSMSTTNIKDWSGSTVRKVHDEVELFQILDAALNLSVALNGISCFCRGSFRVLRFSGYELKIAFGDDYVTSAAASSAHGAQVRAALGAHLPDTQSWVFLMKDGDARVVIVVPNGQITEVGDVTFVSNNAIGWQVTLSTYPDSDGNSIYIMTDDGVVS